MDPHALATRIAAVRRRRACSDAERRAALLLADALRATSRKRRRSTRVQTFWVRPHRGAVHAAFAAMAVVGSVVSVDDPVIGLVLAAGAFVALLGDLSGRLPTLRLLTYRRATQDVVSRDDTTGRPVRLIVTAAVDVPLPGIVGKGVLLRLQTRLRRLLRGRLPGPYGLLVVALAALTGLAVARVTGVEGNWLGSAQLVPSIVCVLAIGAALDQVAADAPREGANADASAAAVAVALVAALDAEPPRNLAVDCVLAGAGGAHALGMRRFVAEERRDGVRAEEVAVLHVAACGAGAPVFWTRDGLVLPLRFHPRLLALAREVAAARPELDVRAHESRDTSGARAARAVRWPAIAVGALDERGSVPHLGDDEDDVAHLDPEAMAATLAFCRALVAALDADLEGAAARVEQPAKRRRGRRATTELAIVPAQRTRSRRGLSPRSQGGATPAPEAPLPPPQSPPPPPTSARAARRAAAEAAARGE